MSAERISEQVELPAERDPAAPQGQPATTLSGEHRVPNVTSPVSREPDTVTIAPLPARTFASQPAASTHSRESIRNDIHVAPNLHELVATAPLEALQADPLAKQQRDLNQVVHSVLIVGLLASTALMLAGVGLALFYQRDLPAAVPDVGDVIGRVLALRPSGFLALGLLVLIATPILRVVGSIGAFLYERDWRFAAITTLVLGVLVVSLLLGRG